MNGILCLVRANDRRGRHHGATRLEIFSYGRSWLLSFHRAWHYTAEVDPRRFYFVYLYVSLLIYTHVLRLVHGLHLTYVSSLCAQHWFKFWQNLKNLAKNFVRHSRKFLKDSNSRFAKDNHFVTQSDWWDTAILWDLGRILQSAYMFLP